MATYFSRCTGTPRWLAVASPSARALRPVARKGVAASASTMIGPAAAILLPGRAGERTELPEGQVAQLPVVGHVDQDAGQRDRHGAERDAGQQHGGDRGPALSRGDAVENEGRHQAAAEGGQRQRIAAEQAGERGEEGRPQHDDRHRAEPGAGRDADQAGIGQRIAKQPLHHRARDGQRRADQHAEHDARQADVEDDDARRVPTAPRCPALPRKASPAEAPAPTRRMPPRSG